MTYRLQNPSMRNSIITTNYGVFRFDSEGITSGVPYALAQELSQLSGFVILDNEGNTIELPETDPDANPSSDSVTLSGGEIWTTIPGGYTIQDSNSVYTLIGSAFESTPPDVSLQSGILKFGSGIDTANVHAVGVDSGTTVQVGTQSYVWQDTDNNAENGLELVQIDVSSDTTRHTLSGGGYYSKIENGYIVGDDDMTYTISGDFLDSDTISIQHGALVFSAGVDTASIHVIGVEPDATLQVGDVVYKWADTNNNLEDGYEPIPYTPEPEVTLPAGWSTIVGGYVIEDNETTYTLTGNFETSDVSIEGTTFFFGEGVDTDSIHLAGVNENDTVYVGSDTYIWQNTDGDATNGYELTPYVEPEPEVHTLPGGATWSTVEGGVAISDTVASYTLVGATSLDSDTLTLDSGTLVFGAGVNTGSVHMLGVDSDSTIQIGETIYQWSDSDNNPENGLELVEYVAPEPQPEVYTLPGGATYETIEGGYVVSDNTVSYTLTGDAFNNGLEDVVDIQSGTFVFDSSVTASDVHIAGIAADTTLKVGEDTYIFKELNNNDDDGKEIEPYTPPTPPVQILPSGATYETIPGGYIVTENATEYTLSGSAFDNGLDGVDVQSGTFTFGSTIDTVNVHVAGVNENDTLYVGEDAFIWSNVDGIVNNGLEIDTITAVVPDPSDNLPEGWRITDTGYAYNDGETMVTITGMDYDGTSAFPVNVDNGVLVFSEGVDTDAIHVIGVYTGDTLKVGDAIYQFTNKDSIPGNGLEITALTPTITLPDGWVSLSGGFAYSSDTTAVTVSGISLDENNNLPVSVAGGIITFSTAVTTDNIHVLGVNENDTLYVGEDTYVFQELDNDMSNGFEITSYVPPTPQPETHTLPGGGTWSTVEGGYVVADDLASYTLMGGALDEDNTAVQSGTLVFGTGIDTSALHVFGVNSDTTIQIGTDIYTWKDTDNNPDNGLELELVVPQSGGVLPSGYVWDTIESGYVIYTNDINYTLSGSAFDNGIEGIVDIQDNHFQFSTNTDINNVHVLGVYSGDTLYVGEEPYIWGSTDNVPTNGLEIMPIPELQPTIPAGWETIEGGVVYTAGENDVTITGITLSVDSPFPIEVENNTFIFSEGVDTGSIHAMGVNESTTLQVGTNAYQWSNTDNDLTNGLEIAEIPAPIVLPEGWGTIDGGLTYNAADTNITITGATVSESGELPVVITGDTLVFGTGIDTADIHVIGVNENDTLQVGDQVYHWKDVDNNLENGYEIAATVAPVPPGSWSTVDGGFSFHNGAVAYTLIGSAFGNGSVPEHVDVVNNALVFDEGIDTSDIHVKGVTANTTIQIGSNSYTWTDLDGNTLNGLELELIPVVEPLPEGWGTIDGGITYTSDTTAVTITGIGLGTDNSLPITYENGGFIFSEGVDTDAVHAIGVNMSDTVQVESTVYMWTDRDNNPENGLELTVIPSESTDTTLTPTVEPEPVSAWSTIPGGYVYESGTTVYTLMGSAFNKGIDDVIIEDGNLSFTNNIDIDNVHVMGVSYKDTVKVGDVLYEWRDMDTNPTNGYELVIVESTDTTLTPTVEPEPTIPPDTINPDEPADNSFSYNFDGIDFTLSGGIGKGISLDDLNEKARIESDGLEFDSGIISTIGSVHIQGLESGTNVKVNGENFTLMDADGNLENGYELVGGEADANDWVRTNRSAGIYEPQIWRHYTNNEVDLLVIGCTARPLFENNTLTLLGDDIKVITNNSASEITLVGNTYGKLASGVGFDDTIGIVNGGTTDSYIVDNGTLYIPSASVSGIGVDTPFTFTRDDTMITILTGTLDVENAVVNGVTVITSILYNNKKFYANVKTGKLVRNAWQRK